MEQIVTYRLTETGLWSYRFYLGRQLIGKVSSVLSVRPVVRVSSAMVSWYSMFRMDTGIDAVMAPGVSRRVMDDRTDLEVFRIVYCEPGFYRMIGGSVNLLVECRDNSYLFGNPGQPVLAMMERIREWPWVPAGEPFFRTTVYEECAPGLLLGMLAFPALRF